MIAVALRPRSVADGAGIGAGIAATACGPVPPCRCCQGWAWRAAWTAVATTTVAVVILAVLNVRSQSFLNPGAWAALSATAAMTRCRH